VLWQYWYVFNEKKNLIQQIEYQKQRKETIDNYRGFQTMDSSDHPVVQRGIKAAELISDVSFRLRAISGEKPCGDVVNVTWWHQRNMATSLFFMLWHHHCQLTSSDLLHKVHALKILLLTQKNYREDWDYDKQLVYYPVHITPEYEAHVDVKKVQSDVCYTNFFKSCDIFL